MTKPKYDRCLQCGRAFSEEEQKAIRNRARSEGAARSWRDPQKRNNRIQGMRAAWDDPLTLAVLRGIKAQ
jgi:hypothetical protein